MKKILIMGLPGAGKTTLAKAIRTEMLSRGLPVVHFNADEIRKNVNKDLGFSPPDRLEQATRLGWLAQQVTAGTAFCICDFVCPLRETRVAFNPDVIIYVNTISSGRFADTNALFVKPTTDESQVFIEVSSFFTSNDEIKTLINKFCLEQPS